jgi:hypothetical protein
MNKNVLITITLVLIGIGVLFALGGKIDERTAQVGVGNVSEGVDKQVNLDAFAECISEAGAKMYGASWCSHCNNQKKMFGESVELMPYVECSSATGGQLKVCSDVNIEAYPTWRFADGSEIVGEATRTELAEKTACSLPEGL